jgi:glycosyltransferase involved in cell wall biosynthesis
VTYPSTYEGFGNAFLEAVYFKKPILVNRYAIYKRDIEPLGFDVITMDTYVTEEIVRNVKAVLKDPQRMKDMVAKNYELAWKFFSYEVLEQKLRSILIDFEGIPVERRDF